MELGTLLTTWTTLLRQSATPASMHSRSTSFFSGPTYSHATHGPHFWCWDTLAYQATVFGKYGLNLRIVGLCSYHAYNRCDGHGAYIKKAARAEQLRGAGPTSTSDFALMTRNLPAAEARGITVCSLLDVIMIKSRFGRRRISESGSRRITPTCCRNGVCLRVEASK